MAPSDPKAPQNPPQAQNQAPVAPAGPSLVGFTPEQLQALFATMGSVSARATSDALRSQRKENPYYPEKSVYNPEGLYADDGTPKPAKVKLSRATFFVGVKLSDELMTADEIELCNRFTTDKTARNGTWKAEIVMHGNQPRLYIDVPSKTIDDRNGLPTFAFILKELLEGPEAVNPVTMAKRIEELEKKLAGMSA